MMRNWRLDPPLKPRRVLFLASDHSLHSVPSERLDDAKKIDPELVVIAHDLEEWQAFQSQLDISRSVLTDDDRRMLSAMAIAWDEQPSLEEFLLAVLPEPPLRTTTAHAW